MGKSYSIIEINGLFLTIVEGSVYGYSPQSTKEEEKRIKAANHVLIKGAVMAEVNLWTKEAKDIVDINYVELTEYTADLQIVRRHGKSQTFRIRAAIISNYTGQATSLLWNAINK